MDSLTSGVRNSLLLGLHERLCGVNTQCITGCSDAGSVVDAWSDEALVDVFDPWATLSRVPHVGGFQRTQPLASSSAEVKQRFIPASPSRDGSR